MRVFVTGATGFIGRALIPRLQRDGHAVVAWVRSPARARGLLGAEVELVHADTALGGLVAAIERSDAVVNLAGEPLMGGRWTAARRAVLERSRIAVTEQLVQAMAEVKTCPRVFISGSAVGYYGDRGDEPLTEASSGGEDFLARLCRRWESAAVDAERLGARVVLLRTGVGTRPGRRRAGADATAVPIRGGRARWIGNAVPAVDSSPRPREDHRRGARRRSLSGTGERRGAGAGDQPSVRARARARALSPSHTSAAGARAQGDLRRGRHGAAGEPARGPARAPGAPVRVRLSDPGLRARGHCRGNRRRDLARAVETRRSRGGSLRAAGQDGDRCAARADVCLLLEGREPRRDHAGCDAIFHSGTGAADGGGGRDRLPRARRSACPFVGARASPNGSRVGALPIFRRRARTASGGTSTHFRPMARAR